VLRQTAHPTESRYEVLALFTVSMIASSLIVVAVGALLPYVGAAFPHERAQICLLVTGLLFGAMLTNAASGAATDRFGDKAVLAVCGVVMGIALLAAAAVPSLAWVIGWFVVYGMGFAAMTPVGSHAILFFFKPEERGVAMGIRQMGVPLGGVAGGIVLSTAAEYAGYRGALAISGVLVLSIAVGCALLYREPAELRGHPIRTTVLLEDMLRTGMQPRLILIAIASFILFAGQVALMGFFPLSLIQGAHLSAAFASIFFVLAQFAAAGGRVAWGWISDRRFHGDRLTPMAIICVLSALACAGVAHAGDLRIPALAAVAVLLGFSIEGWFGLAVIAMAETGGEKDAGSALGFGMTLVMAAGVITPPVFQSLMHDAGIGMAWNALAVLMLAGIVPIAAAIALSRRAQRVKPQSA
jgi:MFS family permease